MVIGILNKSEFTDSVATKLKIYPNLGYLKPKTKYGNTQYNTFLEESSFELYKKTKNYILIPFYFSCELTTNKLINSNSTQHLNKKLTETNREIKLRIGDQTNCYNTVIRECESKDSFSGIINLSTSAGKTVLSLAIIDKLGLKSLILVNKLELLQQWKERISQFLPLANVGIIQGTKFEVDGFDIVIGMVQTIINDRIKMRDLASFGVCIIDEVHSISTKSFGQVFFKITSPFQFGLSATLDRTDDLDIVYRSFLGPVIYSNVVINKKQESIVNVYNCNFELGKFKPSIKLFGEEKPNLAGILNNLCICESRNEFILKTIGDIIQEDSNRKILCMSDRISQLKWLNERLIPESGLFIGKMSSSELKECRKKQVILATYQMVIQGFDQPDINTLVFLTPRSNIEQAIGRIYRQNHSITPMIIDFKDTNFQVLVNQSKKRLKLYKSKIDNVIINIV